MAYKDNSRQKLETEFQTLRESFKTVSLATSDTNGVPEASYAPYIYSEGCYYLFLSSLARHTTNIKLNSQISMLFIENEGDSRNLFARRRIILQGKAVVIERSSTVFKTVLTSFREQFGAIIDVIEPLGDFNLYQIGPYSARFVRGFAEVEEFVADENGDLKQVDK